jgi:hypothetical protein
MKKILSMMLAAVAVFSACIKNEPKDPEGTGTFSLDLSYEGEFQTKADVPFVNIEDFDITLQRSRDGYVRVFKYTQLKAQIEAEGGVALVPGDYTITAVSPDRAPAAFEQPVFEGTSSFTIRTGEVTSVTLVCTLQNMMVTIEPTASFTNELVNYTVIIDNGEGTLVWSKEDVENGLAGFFSVAPLHVHVDGFRFIDDRAPAAVFDGDITNVAAKDHHIITLDAVNTGAVSGIEIKVDYTTNDIFSNFEVPGFPEDGVPGGDEGLGGDEPGGNEPGDDEKVEGLELIWPANPTLGAYPLKSQYETGEVDLFIKADNGIAGFIVKISSPTDSFVSEVKTIAGATMENGAVVLDLLNEETAAVMTFLPTGDMIKDKTYVEFPLGELLPMITFFGPEAGSVHTFEMIVTDGIGQVISHKLEFKFN